MYVAYNVNTKPGAWVREQTARRERRIWLGLLLGLLSLGAFTAFEFRHHASLAGVAGSVGFLAVMWLVRRPGDRFVDKHIKLRSGTRAEVAVGETLERLRGEGWIVMHDLERSGWGNLDHLANGPSGVFLIETKARRYEDSHLPRVKGNAAWLHDQLGVWVTPVTCVNSPRRKPFRTKGVWIVPHAQLLDWLRAQHNPPVDFERLARFADRM